MMIYTKYVKLLIVLKFNKDLDVVVNQTQVDNVKDAYNSVFNYIPYSSIYDKITKPQILLEVNNA